jgi:hypothetical protein
MARQISPSMEIGPLSAPYVLVPLLAMAQTVHVAAPGTEPDLAGPLEEDMRLIDPALANKDGEAPLRWRLSILFAPPVPY